MEICIINNDFSLGGAQKVAIEVAEGLNNVTKYRVSLINFYGNNKFFYNIDEKIQVFNNTNSRLLIEKICFRLAKVGYKITARPIKISNYFKNQLQGLEKILREKEFDCVILCQGMLTAFLPILKNKFPNTKFIVWQHNSYDVYIKNYNKLYIKEYINGLELADNVVCLTEQDKELFRQHNSKVVCIYNPLTINNFKHISKIDKKNIIFTGRISIKQKGLDFLLSMVEKAPEDWSWIIAGDGSDTSKLKYQIKKRGLTKKVILKGALDSEDLNNHYLQGSLFISTSRWEGFGLVITEAMSFGLPIISFDNYGPREILDKGKYGLLIEKYDENKFYNLIAEFMDNPSIRKVYQEKSLKRVRDFSKEKIISQWVELIRIGERDE